jgi:murein DD-endopeptidase MepM/ murein hydrolase activator NlpD
LPGLQVSHEWCIAGPQQRLCRRLIPGLLLVVLLVLALFPARPVAAHPQLIVPTPPGEGWRIIQGYACGTHNSWDRYSLDLVSAGERTYGAPVRASADGTIWAVEYRSGTVILNHGGGFFTMYTHLASFTVTSRGTFAPRGMVLGTVGDRGSPGNPHLHFTAFTASSSSMRSWRSVPLSFAEGYVLPEIGGCNQHYGKVLTANGELLNADPKVAFSSPAQPGTWYNSDQRIEFTTTAAWQGISQAWNAEAEGDQPMFANATAGYAQLADAGEGFHTLHVTAWGVDDRRVLATYGPIGYDVTAPEHPAPLAAPVQLKSAGETVPRIDWSPGRDNAAGVAGYRVYLGPDLNGTSAWFVEAPFIEPESLSPGTYHLRLQVVDNASNKSDWRTIGQVIVAED